MKTLFALLALTTSLVMAAPTYASGKCSVEIKELVTEIEGSGKSFVTFETPEAIKTYSTALFKELGLTKKPTTMFRSTRFILVHGTDLEGEVHVDFIFGDKCYSQGAFVPESKHEAALSKVQ